MRTQSLITIPLTALLLLGATGCSLRPPAPQETRQEAVEQPTQATTATVPDVLGMPGDQAQDTLEAAGLDVGWDAGEDSVWAPSNWTVNAQNPAAGTEVTVGVTVTLTVSKPAGEEPAQDATSTGLTGSYAQSACDTYAKTQFPFGFDGHWILGKMADEIQNDRWFFKLTADVTNEYDAEREVTIECYVSGTNEAPTVEDFLAY